MSDDPLSEEEIDRQHAWACRQCETKVCPWCGGLLTINDALKEERTEIECARPDCQYTGEPPWTSDAAMMDEYQFEMMEDPEQALVWDEYHDYVEVPR